MELTVTVSHDASVFERSKPEWDALQLDSEANRIYLTCDWISLWWQHFGEDEGQLWLLEVRDEAGSLIGIAPLMLVHMSPIRGVRWRQLQFTGTSLALEHLDIVSQRGREQDVLNAVLDFLKTRRKQWDVLCLNHLIEHSTTLALLRQSNDLPWQEEKVMITPFLILPDNWDDYYSSLSKNKRKNQRRFRRALDEQYPDGRWHWRLVTDQDELAEAVDELIMLHQDTWEARGEQGAFAGKRTDFFRDVAQRFLERGWLLLSRLEFDGQLAASQFAYCYQGRIYNYSMGINHDFDDLSPGHMLREMVLRHAIKTGVKEYDFLWGDQPHKYSWGAETRHDWNMCWIASPRARLEQTLIEGLHSGWQLTKRLLPTQFRKRLKKAVQE